MLFPEGRIAGPDVQMTSETAHPRPEANGRATRALPGLPPNFYQEFRPPNP